MSKRVCRKTDDIAEVRFPDIIDGQLDPMIDLLTELLAKERLRELEDGIGDDQT